MEPNEFISQQTVAALPPSPKSKRWLVILVVGAVILFVSSVSVWLIYTQVKKREVASPVLGVRLGMGREIVEKTLGAPAFKEMVSFGTMYLYGVEPTSPYYHAVAMNGEGKVNYISEIIPNSNKTLTDFTQLYGNPSETYFGKAGMGTKVYIFKKPGIIISAGADGQVLDITRYDTRDEEEVFSELKSSLYSEDPYIL